jgi:hypothetical protein
VDFSVHYVPGDKHFVLKNCCLIEELQLMVVSGATGCGKTHLLGRLGACGQQVLDLELLAKHKGGRRDSSDISAALHNQWREF